jgi:NAD(P)-dependent dehydrogenase (short-subunit alcohol dehydrogenase family)
MYKNIAVIGSSGAIGKSFLKLFSQYYPNANIHAFSRSLSLYNDNNINHHILDYEDEESIVQSALIAAQNNPLDCVIIATGILHFKDLQPEKSLRDLSFDKFSKIFKANTIIPALIAKHFVPKLAKNKRVIFAALSARVGSISDNQFGGWYSYRASKAALNMVIKNIAIEIERKNKEAIIVALHPGTVNSTLSAPFLNSGNKLNIFEPEQAAEKLLSVINQLSPEDSGKFFDYNGDEIEP